MPWWGKSSKEGKKSRKGSVVDTDNLKLKIVSEDKGPRSGTSRRQYTETVSQNAENYSANYQHPSPSVQVLGSGKSRAQPVPFQQGHHSATNLVDFGVGRSKRTGCERGSLPPLLHSFIKPIKIIETPDGKYIDMEFMNASVSTNDFSDCDDPYNQVSGYKTPGKTSAKCPSGPLRAREIRVPSNSWLNNQSVSIYPKRQPKVSFSAPNSSVSSPSVTPRRVIRNGSLISSGSGKSHANTSLPSSGHSSFQTVHISGQSSVRGNVPELINRQQKRFSPECSPTLSPIMASVHNYPRVDSAAVTPLHLPVEKACPERSIRWSDNRKQQSYKLPLPPVTKSSPVSMSPSYSTSSNYQVLQSPVKADNLSNPGPRWKKGHLIGCGTFGQVYLGFNSENGEMCAMKEVTLYPDDPKSKESARQLSQEIALLSELHHPNIVQYYGSEMVDNNIYIYLEYVSGGSIHKVLQDYGPLGESALRSFAHQILSGLAYLHAKNTAHRDVKGANILLQPDGCVKLADFGMAKHITAETGRMSFKGSPYWIAPEVVRNSNANVSVDIWSLGCTILEMATGKPPWSQYEEVAALFKIGHNKELPPIPDSLSEEGKDFVFKCLERDPLQRHTAAQLLEHPFVKSFTHTERHIPSLELVEAKHIPTNRGNQQRRNQQFLDPGGIRQIRGSGTVTPISTDHSPKIRSCPVSPVRNLLPKSQSPRYMSATRLTPILTPHSSSGSSLPTSVDSGSILFHHPRTPQYKSKRLSPTSLATPRGRPSSSAPIVSGNVRPCHHSESSCSTPRGTPTSCSTPISTPRVATPTSCSTPRGTPSSSSPIAACNVRQRHHLESSKQMLERLTLSPISSPRAASAGSLAHLAGGNVSLPFHTKSSIKNMHGNPVSMSRHHNSSYSSANTSYQDVKSDMFRHVRQTPLIPQGIPMHSSVKTDQIGRNVPSELANRVSQQRPRELREHVKFSCS